LLLRTVKVHHRRVETAFDGTVRIEQQTDNVYLETGVISALEVAP